ncbi:hypothetical protein VKS41_002951 [Umbelopsis sp. WA50703]
MSGRFLVLVTLILANFVVVEFLGHEDRTTKVESEVIHSVQKLSDPVPSNTLNTVVDAVKEKIDLPMIGTTLDNANVMPPEPETSPHEESTDTQDATATSEDSKEADTVSDNQDAEDSTAVSENVPDHHEEKGNSDAHFVDAHDTIVPTTKPGELTLGMLQKKHNHQDDIQQTDPDQAIAPEIDGRQRHDNQIKRQSLLLPELVPQIPAASQSTDLPRRQFSIMHKRTKSTDAKPKRLFSIFKKKT